MSLNKRTKRRLLAVVTVFALLCGSIAVAYVVRERSLDHQAAQSLIAGYQSYEERAYEQAVDQIGRGIQRIGDDAGAKAFYHYAMARIQVPMPNSKHVMQAASSLRRAVDIDPSYTPAVDELLNINIAMGRDTEALVLAEEVLADHPDNVPALRAKAIALQRARKLDEALVVSQRLNEVDPENLSFHYMTLSLLEELGQTDQQLLEYAQKLREMNTRNPAFTVLLARVLLSMHQQDEAIALLKQAARDAVGSPSAMEIVSQMERLGVGLEDVELLALAQQVARKTLAQESVPALRTWLLQQCWEQGQLQAIFQDPSVKTILEGQTTAPAMDQAIVVLALLRMQKQQQADVILDALAQQTHDPVSMMWAKVIRGIGSDPQLAPADLVALCREALRVDPANPYFRYWLAESLAQQGETDEAIQTWRQVMSQRPSWWLPLVRLSREYLKQGDTEAAMKIAGTAVGIHRNNSEVIVTWSDAMMAYLADRDDAANHKLLQSIEAFGQAWPDDQRLMLMRVGMLIRLGDVEAATTLARDLIDTQRLSQSSLFKLMQMSQQAGLNLESDALAEVRSRFGQTPDIVWVEAVKLYEAGQPAAGRALIDEALTQAQDAQQPGYALAQARYLELSEDADAIEAWRQLGQAYPQNTQIQHAILGAQGTWSDRALIQATLKRLGDQVGSSDVAWREAQARWLIESPQGERDIAAGAQIVSQIVRQQPRRVEARLLLANAMSRLNNVAAAREQMEQVVAIRPQWIEGRLNLVQMDHVLGNVDAASAQVRELATDLSLLAPQQAQRLASLAVALHEDEVALALLDSSALADFDSPQVWLDRADIHVRQGQFDLAHQRLGQAVAGASEPAMFSRAIGLYFRMGSLGEIQALGQLIGQTSMPGVDRLKLQAQIAERLGDARAAADHLVSALKVQPGDVEAWLRLIRVQMALEGLPAALASARQAKTAVSESTLLAALRDALVLASDHPDEPYLEMLAQGGLYRPDDLPAIVEAMQAIASQGWAGQPTAGLLAQLRQLADRYPEVVLLQNLFAHALLASGDREAAIELALRTMQAHPEDPMSAQMASRSLFEQQQWGQAMAAARAWRQRAIPQALAANLMIASIQLQTGDSQACLATLEPYLASEQMGEASSEDSLELRRLQILAQGRLGQWAQIERELTPRLGTSPRWSALWIEVGMLASPSPDEALAWLNKLESKLDVSDVAGRVGLVQAYATLARSLDRQDVAEQAGRLAQAVAQQGGLSESQWLTLGVSAEQLGAIALARASYEHALATGQPIHPAANNLAMVLLRQGDSLDDALAWGHKALAWNSQEAHYWDTLGQVHRKRGERIKAVEAFEKAHELDPDNPQWVVELAHACLQANQPDRARQWIDSLATYRWSGRPLNESQTARLDALNADLGG